MEPVNPFRTKKFLELFEKWNKKLVKAGHNEIEDFSRPDPSLKSWDNFKFKKVTPDEYETKTKYYANARNVLNKYEFQTPLHRKIWELHSEGLSLRDIEIEIKMKYKKDTINMIIQKIKLQAMPR